MPCLFILQPLKSGHLINKGSIFCPKGVWIALYYSTIIIMGTLTGYYIKIRLCVQCVNEPVMFIGMMCIYDHGDHVITGKCMH